MTRRARVAAQTAAVVLAAAVATGWGVPAGAAPLPAGVVWSTGNDFFGQLGNGDATGSVYVFAPASDELEDVTALAAGGVAGYGLQSDGTVLAWGRNDRGQLGDGSTVDRPAPVQVAGLTGATAVASNGDTGYALRSDGTVWAWGRNDFGQVGDGTTVDRLSPVQVTGLVGVSEIAAGSRTGYARLSDGSVRSWGDNAYGQLGNGTTTANSATAVSVTGLAGVERLGAGRWAGYAIDGDGGVHAWGANWYGQLADGTTVGRNVPVPVIDLNGQPLTDVTEVAGGGDFALALRSDGTVWSWGTAGEGQQGGFDNQREYAALVGAPAPLDLGDVVAIAAGGSCGYAIRTDGTVFAWGQSQFGQLGLARFTGTVPAGEASGLTGVTALAANHATAYALVPSAS